MTMYVVCSEFRQIGRLLSRRGWLCTDLAAGVRRETTTDTDVITATRNGQPADVPEVLDKETDDTECWQNSHMDTPRTNDCSSFSKQTSSLINTEHSGSSDATHMFVPGVRCDRLVERIGASDTEFTGEKSNKLPYTNITEQLAKGTGQVLRLKQPKPSSCSPDATDVLGSGVSTVKFGSVVSTGILGSGISNDLFISTSTPSQFAGCSTERVDGSDTGCTVDVPEVVFDELSSSSSLYGLGFVGAEDFISQLLRDEETPSVTSSDDRSTTGDSCDVTTSSESEPTHLVITSLCREVTPVL